MSTNNEIHQWLMEGDPAIRWQVMRDLMDAPEAEWQSERQCTIESGWGARYLALQSEDGSWGSGIYSPKWTSTTYTLLTLCSIGIPGEWEAARRGARLALDRLLGPVVDESFQANLTRLDRCIVGMMLQIGVYFKIQDDRILAIVKNLMDERMDDGAWNCRRNHRPVPHHSSFHTTFNVLEGLREYIENYDGALREQALAAEAEALEFMLQHRLFKSHRTGEVIHPKFTLLSFPYRWHYDILRGLDYFARANAPRDPRLKEAVELLRARRRMDGYWPVQNKYAGKSFFEMEKVGRPSRWNTLRALRVIKWWEKQQ